MAAASIYSRKRAMVQRLQDVQCQPSVPKRKKTRGFKGNTDPREEIHENWERFSKSKTRDPACTRPAGQVQFSRPQVRVAFIRKNMIQAEVQVSVEQKSGRCLTDQSDLGSNENRLDNRKMIRITESQVRSRSSLDLIPDKLLNIRTNTSWRSERFEGPVSSNEKRHLLKTRTRPVAEAEIRMRKRRKVQPSAFRGRGQLRLSITQGAGHLQINVHEARGLMGKSQMLCDSYVKLTVTSDLGHSIKMKTQVVLNNKHPKYNHGFILGVGDDLLHNRLLVSAFRQADGSRCSQLIGCMSFGIGSLVSASENVSGWFYLLGEEFGRSKHLRVTSQRSRTKPEVDGGTQLPADLKWTPDSGQDIDLNHVPKVSAGLKNTISNRLSCSSSSSCDPSNTYQHQNTCGSVQRLMVSIVRGKDGFGFTICSDCPVRVQAVDPDGPAQQSGLRQGDCVLQLNGLPVETWKCTDLAHTIRSSTHIVMVVWRGLPELRPGCEEVFLSAQHSKATNTKLLPPPAHTKQGRRRGQGSGVRSSFGALSSLWKDKRPEQEEVDDEKVQEFSRFSHHTTTLKGTHVTSSNGDNYIILSPFNPGEQLLQPVYPDDSGTIGRLYQTHPRRGQRHLPDQRLGSSQQSFTPCTSTLCLPTSSSSSAQPRNYSNYQNCTMVQSHLPCSSYGTYITLAPKTLVFPVFIQPLDLCSPNRTLLLSEEMLLHQAELPPAKVTVLIYTDLLLLTREDEAGCCNVLQSPLYLNMLQIREVSSEPLHIFILEKSQTGCRYLFSLESFSAEQKVKVSLCLQDNVQPQLVTTETGCRPQLPDLPSNFGLLSLGQSDLLLHPSAMGGDPLRPPSPSSYPPALSPPHTPYPPFPLPSSCFPPYASSSPPTSIVTSPPDLHPPPPFSSLPTQISPIWKERERTDEKEERRQRSQEETVGERQQAEGESASETSENVGVVGGQVFPLSSHPFNMEEGSEGRSAEEMTSCFRPAILRRSFSEGSLWQEPRSPRFLSDSTIHQLTRMAFDLEPGSDQDRRQEAHALKKQLAREGGSLHQMLLLFTSNKDPEARNVPLKMKTRSLAADVRSRLPFLRRHKNSNSLEKALKNNRPSEQEVLSWGESLEALLTNQYGVAVFRYFLRSEFSEENLDFWLAAERFKKIWPLSKMAARAEKIYAEFISTTAARQVNVDSSVRESTNQSLRVGVNPASFQLAQDQVFGLMEADSYPRFLKSHLYKQLTNQGSANQRAGLCLSVSDD